MSLVTQLQAGFTRVGTEFKTAYGKIGDLTSLSTTAKTSLVAAINELEASISGAGAVINDASASTSSVYSSSKTQSVANAAAAALINDSAADTTHAYSSSKTASAISTAINNLINSAPGTLDTLGEIATQMATDESGVAALTTAVNNRVRYDAAMSLTSPQMIQATSNIGAATVATVGDTTTDFAAGFVAALT